MILTTGHLSKQTRLHNKGFTLLELVLVMALSAALLSMTAPSLRNFTRSKPLSEAAAQFIALTEYARTQAALEGRIYLIYINLENNTFQLTAEEEGEFQDLGKEFGRIFHLPEGISFYDFTVFSLLDETDNPGLMLSDSMYQENEEGEKLIAFFPDGFTQPSSFFLKSPAGNTLEILCDSPIEGFRIETPEQDYFL
ncbi:MAG: prepilin-type N-terminal cleavage/methylation domain-containing protein [Candidatus Ratteibacteria bacterium]|jgi:prepilin-type N-terminal cleavage/methylation domain-containing protein